MLTHTDCLMRSLTAADGAAYLIPPEHKAAAFNREGKLIHIRLSGSIPLASWLDQGLEVWLADRRDCRMPFALMEVLPCFIPQRAETIHLGMCGEMTLHAGDALSLHGLWTRRKSGAQQLTFGNAYALLRREITAVWAAAAAEISREEAWDYNDWVTKAHRLPGIAAEDTALTLHRAGLIAPVKSIRAAFIAMPMVRVE